MRESNDKVEKQVRKSGLTFKNLMDSDGEVSSLYGVTSTPTKFIIDTEGNMVGTALGYRDWNDDKFKKLINLLMRP